MFRGHINHLIWNGGDLLNGNPDLVRAEIQLPYIDSIDRMEKNIL